MRRQLFAALNFMKSAEPHCRIPRSTQATPLSPGVVIAATLDTKFEEIALLQSKLHALGLPTILIDCGVLAKSSHPVDIGADQIARLAGSDLEVLRKKSDREVALPLMMRGLEACMRSLISAGLVRGFLGVGGATNCALAAAAFREMPLGLPKLVVSTTASGNTGPLVGFKDVVLVHSVVDILGTGSYLRDLMTRSARLMQTLVADAESPKANVHALRVGITAFGSTTAAASHASHL